MACCQDFHFENGEIPKYLDNFDGSLRYYPQIFDWFETMVTDVFCMSQNTVPNNWPDNQSIGDCDFKGNRMTVNLEIRFKNQMRLSVDTSYIDHCDEEPDVVKISREISMTVDFTSWPPSEFENRVREILTHFANHHCFRLRRMRKRRNNVRYDSGEEADSDSEKEMNRDDDESRKMDVDLSEPLMKCRAIEEEMWKVFIRGKPLV